MGEKREHEKEKREKMRIFDKEKIGDGRDEGKGG
jgi:hypothetical protein